MSNDFTVRSLRNLKNFIFAPSYPFGGVAQMVRAQDS
jgi:hypothetical protein